MPAHREPADVAAGEEDRRDDVRVGRDDEPASRRAGSPRRRPSRRGRLPPASASGAPRHEDLLDQRAHRAPAGAVLQRDALARRSAVRSSHAPRRDLPQVGMAAVLVPDPARALAAAPCTRRPARRARTPCRRAGSRCGDAMPAMMSPQMHCCDERAAARSPRARARSIVEAAARVDVRELVAQAQVAVRHVRDAAPAAARRAGTPARAAPARARCPRASRSAGTCSRPRRVPSRDQLDQRARGRRGCRAARSRRRRPACRGARRTARRRPSR